MPEIVSLGALTVGLSAAREEAYVKAAPAYAWLDLIADRNIPSDGEKNKYSEPESPPYFVRRDDGKATTYDAFKFYDWETPNLTFSRGIEIKQNDMEDDKTGRYESQARAIGANEAALDEEVIVKQIVAGTADPELLDSIPNAPDGIANFSTTTRFSDAGGNIQAGTGVASSAAVLTDFFTMWGRLARWTDTKGKPYHNMTSLREFAILYRPTNQQVIAEAFIQKLRAQGAITATSNAGVSSIVQELGLKVHLLPSTYIGGNAIHYFVIGGEGPRLAYVQKRRAIDEHVFTAANDRDAAERGVNKILWDFRKGYASKLPLKAFRSTN